MMETVDAIRTKSSLVEDENIHYRRECAKLMQKLAQVTASKPAKSTAHVSGPGHARVIMV